MKSIDIETFLKSIRECKTSLMSANEDLNKHDKLTQDLLHRLELETLTYHKKAKTAIQLEEVRRERRKAKDTIEILEPIVKYCEDNKKALDHLNQLLGTVRNIEHKHKNRIYTPKVLEQEGGHK